MPYLAGRRHGKARPRPAPYAAAVPYRYTSKELLGPDTPEAARRKLDEQAAFNELVLEEIGDAVIVYRSDGRPPFFNRAAREIIGADVDPDLPVERYSERYRAFLSDGRTLLAPEDQPLVKALAGERTEGMELIIKPADQPPRRTIWGAVPLRDADGKIIGSVATGRDLTELFKREDEARRLRAMTGDVVIDVDMQGRLLRANPAWEATFGRRVEDDVGTVVLDFVHPEDRDDALPVLDRMQANQPTMNHEERWRKADGGWVWMNWNIIPDRERGVTYAIGRDVTERRQSRQRMLDTLEELERSNRDLQAFASVASHDLQEPLRKIQAFSKRIVSHAGDSFDAKTRNYFSRIESAGGRMQVLIDDLLTFSRVRTKEVELRPVDLRRTALTVLEDMSLDDATVTVGDLPVVAADRTQMRQLLQNLVGNALKFKKPDRPAVVEVTGHVEHDEATDEEVAVIRVRDEGIGFEPRYVDKLFKIFQRLHGRGTYEGTGVGLAVCRQIALRHGGSITATGEPGVGATFEVRLPVRDARRREQRTTDALVTLGPDG